MKKIFTSILILMSLAVLLATACGRSEINNETSSSAEGTVDIVPEADTQTKKGFYVRDGEDHLLFLKASAETTPVYYFLRAEVGKKPDGINTGDYICVYYQLTGDTKPQTLFAVKWELLEEGDAESLPDNVKKWLKDNP